MAYNNGFPIGYPQFYPQQFPQQFSQQQMSVPQQFSQQQMSVPQQFSQQQMSVPQQQTQQMMTPPTIHAEIVQVSDRQEAMNFPVGAGQAQMMIARDDSAIFVKTAFANGQSSLVEYARKAPEPEVPPADYVTREEFERRLAELVKPPKKERKVQENESDV